MQGVSNRTVSGQISVRSYIIAIFISLFVLTISLWHLGTLTAGLGPQEYITKQHAQTAHQIFEFGVNAPYYLLLHAALKIHGSQIFYLRLTSVIIGLLVFFCLFKIIAMGFGKIVAIYTSIIFATTPWILLSTRSAETAIMWQWLIVVVAFFAWALRQKGKPGTVLLLLSAVTAISLYIPGLVWLLILGLIIGKNRFILTIKKSSRSYIIAATVIFLVLIAPLLVALISHPVNIKVLLLLPAKFPTIVELLKSIAWSFLGIFWRTQSHIDMGIGRLPLLNILQVALCVFGIYALLSRTKRLTYFLGIIILLSIIAAGINQDPELLLIGMPALTIFIAAGLRYLYLEWRRVFPLNPFAKSLAIVLILIVVIMQIFYGLRYSLVAWPNTEATKSTYVLK